MIIVINIIIIIIITILVIINIVIIIAATILTHLINSMSRQLSHSFLSRSPPEVSHVQATKNYSLSFHAYWSSLSTRAAFCLLLVTDYFTSGIDSWRSLRIRPLQRFHWVVQLAELQVQSSFAPLILYSRNTSSPKDN